MMQPIPLTKAESEDTKHNIQTIVELMEFYGLDTKDLNYTPTHTHWSKMTERIIKESADDGDGELVYKSRVITFTKYKVAAYVASLSNCTLPPCPFDNSDNSDDPKVLIGGRFHQWMTKIILKPTGKEAQQKKLSIIQSLIQSKGGLTKPDEEFVRYAEIKLFDKLTTERKTLWADEADREHIKEQLRRTAREIFTKEDGKFKKYTDSAKFAFGLPSASSNYNNSRKMYGALGHCLKHVKSLGLTNKKLLEFKKTNVSRSTEDEEMRENADENEYDVNALPLSKAVHEFRKLVMEEALGEIPYAVPFGLSEPGKPRVITKGPPATYYILKTLQKYMHNHMRTLPVFELIGKTISANVMTEAIPRLDEEEKYLSGDYSDATNELEAWVCDTITEELCTVLGIDSIEKDLMDKSLTKHIMELRDRLGIHILKRSKQLNGQLMGSILSFLWLCIANVTLVRMSKEEGEGRPISLKELEARINGDDCCFAANKEVKELWESYGRIMGLKPSIGKVFWTREFVTMNSRMFVPGQTCFWEVPFISLSLLNNTEKSVRLGVNNKPNHENLMAGLETIGSRNQWLMMGCPIQLRKKVQSRFIQINKEALDLSHLDWFMPEWSGGLGICDVADNGWILNATSPMPGNPPETIVDEDLQTEEYKLFNKMRNEKGYRTKSRAALFNMITHWGDPKFTPRPLTSVKLPINLDIMGVIQNLMPCKPKEVLTFGTEKLPDDIYDQLFGMCTMAAYLTDEATQLKIAGKVEKAINLGDKFRIEKERIVKITGNSDTNRMDVLSFNREGTGIVVKIPREEEIYQFKEEEREYGKKRKRAIEDEIKDINMEEWERRVKHNRKVWKNNLQVGCSKLADWRFLQRRTYMKVFKGHIVGRGVAALKEAGLTFFKHIENPGFWEDLRDRIDDWD